jgi:hypothetical protein
MAAITPHSRETVRPAPNKAAPALPTPNPTRYRMASSLRITIDLFATPCQQRHRHIEWLKFLKQMDANVTPGLHTGQRCGPQTSQGVEVAGAAATLSQARHRNQRFFRNLSEDRLRCCVFKSVDELIAAIELLVPAHNAAPKPFIWTKRPGYPAGSHARLGQTQNSSNKVKHYTCRAGQGVAQGLVFEPLTPFFSGACRNEC